MDFGCIHQCCRDAGGVPRRFTFKWLSDKKCFADDAVGREKEEDKLFKQALGSLGAFYSHATSIVLKLTRFPPDYEDPMAYTRSGNIAIYENRGWCFCESSWGMVKARGREWRVRGEITNRGKWNCN